MDEIGSNLQLTFLFTAYALKGRNYFQFDISTSAWPYVHSFGLLRISLQFL